MAQLWPKIMLAVISGYIEKDFYKTLQHARSQEADKNHSGEISGKVLFLAKWELWPNCGSKIQITQAFISGLALRNFFRVQ